MLRLGAEPHKKVVMAALRERYGQVVAEVNAMEKAADEKRKTSDNRYIQRDAKRVGDRRPAATDEGIVFSRGSVAGGLDAADAGVVIERIGRALLGGGLEQGQKIIVKAPTFSALPASILAKAAKEGHDGSDVQGVLHEGKVYVVLDKIASAEGLEGVIFHELYGHYVVFGCYYTVKIAFPISKNYAEKKGWKRLWGRSAVPAATSGTQLPGC